MESTIDGVRTAYSTNAVAAPGYSQVTINYSFANNTTHHVFLAIKGGFRGVTVSTGNTVTSYALPKPNLLIVEGDSYTEGYNPLVKVSGYQSFWFDGWVWQLSWLQPNTIVVPCAIGGTGFLAPPTYGGRVVADICTLYSNAVSSGKYNQIFITASGTINDLGAAAGTLFNAATSVYSTLQNACPQAHIFVLGNWLGAGGRLTPQSTDIANDNDLANVAVTSGLAYFSPIQAGIRNAANYNTFFPPGISDSVHPSAAGYAIMAQWVNTNLSYTFGTNWNANSQQGSGTLFYRLTVNSGSGSGYYTNGQVVNITATNIFGSYFTNWTGDIVTDPNQATTTVTMPAASAVVTANLVVVPSAASINITDYGAVGDAVRFAVQTTSNSPMVSVLGTNRFTAADIGKVIEVFHAGPWLNLNNNPASRVVVTNQDTICFITNVTEGTNLWGSIPQGWTKQTDCIVGQNNRVAFQTAIDTAESYVSDTNQNVTINIPDGTYLIIGPKAMNPNYVMGLFDNDISLSISSGGLTFMGASTNTVLMGCGAGMNHVFNDATVYGTYGHFNPLRGTLLQCLGPVTNSQYPLAFQNLTFDGGLTNGLQNYNYFTLYEGNGEGWDTSHDALLDINPDWAHTQMHQMKIFTNCVFQHWRGEILKNVTSNPGGTNTFIEVANCVFQDGNASAINLYFGQHTYGCVFKDLVKVEEYYQKHTTLPSVFENNLWTNIISNPFSIVGSTTNENPPSFTLRNNVFCGLVGQNQIHFAPAENVSVISNAFYGPAFGVVFSGIGVQPTDGSASVISNIVIACNAFNNSTVPISMDGYPATSVLVSNNTSATIAAAFASIAGGWKTNILYVGNTSTGWLDASGVQAGGYPFDAANNHFGSIIWDGGLYAATNAISYGSGRTHTISRATSTFFLDDTQPGMIPEGATLSIKNTDAATALIYSSGKLFQSALSGPKASLAAGQTIDYAWTNGFWKRIVVTTTPPQNLAPGP